MTDVANGSAVLDQSVPSTADWRPFLNDDLKADPVVSGFAEKTNYKDIPSLIKGLAHAQHRMGSAINLPGKDAKPEEIQALKDKLYQSGVLAAPPTDVSVYNLQKPETLAVGTQWNDALAKSFGDTLLKHGASPEFAQDMLALYGTAMSGQVAALQVSAAESVAALRSEHGEQYEAAMEAGERLAQSIYKTPEEVAFFAKTGLGKHPAFLSVMTRLGLRAMQDSSFVDQVSAGAGSTTGAAALEELTKIQTDSTHPMHKGFMANDPKVQEHISGLYRKAYPGTVTLG